MALFPPRSVYTVPLPTRRVLRLGERCLVMGVLNVTPDSFAGGITDRSRAVDAALRMEEDGADLIDIGGESTRPGAEPVAADEERARVVPVIEALAPRLRIPISVDTSKSGVARDALGAGAVIVNDVTAGRGDPAVVDVVAECDAAIVLMHSRGTPKTMAEHAKYGDLIGEISAELKEALLAARRAGVLISRIIVDPGIGFAKRPAHSYGVLARLPELAAALDRPVLVGPSRKSFLREAVIERDAAQRDWGTAAAVTAAALGGAHIVRVHAVAEMAQVVRVAEEIRRNADAS